MSSFRDRLLQQTTFEPKLREFEFDEIYFNQVKLSKNDTDSGRYYNSPSGKQLISVTTLLSKTADKDSIDALDRWRERIGYGEADKITKFAADRGEALHKLCEDYIAYPDRFELPPPGTNVHSLFKQIYPCFKNIGRVYGIESTLYSDKFNIAGTADCIAEYNGVLSIIDFKSTRKEKKREYIRDYFIQETAYCIMFSEMYNLPVKQIVTLMARDYGSLSEPQVFIENPVNYIDELYTKLKNV